MLISTIYCRETAPAFRKRYKCRQKNFCRKPYTSCLVTRTAKPATTRRGSTRLGGTGFHSINLWRNLTISQWQERPEFKCGLFLHIKTHFSPLWGSLPNDHEALRKGGTRCGWGSGGTAAAVGGDLKCLIFNKCVNFTYRGKWVFIEELVNFLWEK